MKAKKFSGLLAWFAVSLPITSMIYLEACKPRMQEAELLANGSNSKIIPTADSKCVKFFQGIDQATLAQRDEIYTLMAYAVVYKDWQSKNTKVPRGHNIGGVLVNPRGEVVWWGRNSRKITCNGTQHGETRMMLSYMDVVQTSNLRCHTIYTTLEPCAMCSGMMSLQKITRSVFGHTDPDFGQAMERLNAPFNGKRLKRTVVPHSSPSKFRVALDSAQQEFIDVESKNLQARGQNPGLAHDITAFLLTDTAKKIYSSATERFLAYGDQEKLLPANAKLYERAKRMYLANVTDHYVPLNQLVAVGREELRGQRTLRGKLRPPTAAPRCNVGFWDQKPASPVETRDFHEYY